MICDSGGIHETLSSEFISDWFWSIDEIDGDNDDDDDDDDYDDDDDKDNPIIVLMRAYIHTHIRSFIHTYIVSYVRTCRCMYVLCSIF
jgi:hypothetical protein